MYNRCTTDVQQMYNICTITHYTTAAQETHKFISTDNYNNFSSCILGNSATLDSVLKLNDMIWYDMIYLLNAVGLTPAGSSTVHIYTQIIYRTTQWNRIHRTEHK